MISNITQRSSFFWLVVVLIVVNYAFGSTLFPLFDLDEGAYAEVSREMVASGNYFSTMVNGVPFYDKPALMYWLQAISISLFGTTEFGFRLPSVIALMAWLALIYHFVKEQIGQRVAQYAVLVALTSAGVTVLFKAAIPDAFLNLFITATLFQVYLFIQDEKPKHLNYAYAFMALGVLTKGPIAIVIPFCTVFSFLVIKKKIPYLWKMIFCWQGWLIFIVLALPWYIVQYVQFGNEFIEGFFGKHNVGRFMNAMEGHTGGVFFYVGALLILSMPFTVTLITSFIKIKQGFKQDIVLFLWLWFIFVFIFFTISATKLPHYLMYGMTPIWIILGYYLVSARSIVWGVTPALVLLVVITIFPVLIEYLSQSFDDPYVQQTYQNLSQDLPQWFNYYLIGSVIVILGSLFFKKLSVQSKILLAALLCSFSISFALLPMMGNFQQGVVKKAGLYVKKHDLKVVVWDLNMPSFNVYAQRISEQRKPKIGETVLTKTLLLQQFEQVNYLINYRGIALAEIIR